MIRLLGQMMMLPVTALTTSIDVFTRTIRGMQRTDDGGPPAGRPAGARSDSAGVRHGGRMDDEQIKLVEYTIVSLKRGDEQIVDRGQTVVSERITPDVFSSRLVEDLSKKRSLKSAESKQLRVYFQVLTRWPQPKRSGAA